MEPPSIHTRLSGWMLASGAVADEACTSLYGVPTMFIAELALDIEAQQQHGRGRGARVEGTLQERARKLLDGKMREIRGANRMAAVDRVAVLAALNLAHELQQLRDRDAEIDRTLDALERRLDGVRAG